ncbi:MAG: DinB family protein [Acidimicrobiia bacterium]
MPDQKPPKSTADERATLHTLMQYHRDSVVRKVMGVDELAARTSPVSSGTTLLWLVKHLAMAETLWVLHRFAGEPAAVVVYDEVTATDTVADAIAVYRATWHRVDAVAAAADLETVCANLADEPATNLRWVLMHLLEETARHAGHADILRELIDGHTGR